MKSVLSFAMASIGAVNGAGMPFSYTGLGSTWPGLKAPDGVVNQCGTGNNQSPIDLTSPENTADWERRAYKIYDGSIDQFTKLYENPYQATAKWNKDTFTTQIDFKGAVTGPMMFTSNIAQQVYGAPRHYNGVQFHFHHRSEHTIDGQLFDFCMHTVHFPAKADPTNGYIAAAVGIIFDTEKYNAKLTWAEQKIIDNFFDNLRLDEEDPVVDWVLYSDLLSLVNTDNRWVYRGSVTTPPCAENVYWNVMTTIYPMKKEHLELFKAKLAKAGVEENRRTTQTDANKQHDVIYLKNNNIQELALAKQSAGAALAGLMAVFAFFLILMCASICYLGMKARGLQDKQ